MSCGTMMDHVPDQTQAKVRVPLCCVHFSTRVTCFKDVHLVCCCESTGFLFYCHTSRPKQSMGSSVKIAALEALMAPEGLPTQ